MAAIESWPWADRRDLLQLLTDTRFRTLRERRRQEDSDFNRLKKAFE